MDFIFACVLPNFMHHGIVKVSDNTGTCTCKQFLYINNLDIVQVVQRVVNTGNFRKTLIQLSTTLVPFYLQRDLLINCLQRS